MNNHNLICESYYKEYLSNNKILLKNARKKVLKLTNYEEMKEDENNIFNNIMERNVSYYRNKRFENSTRKVYFEMPWNLVSVYIYRLRLSGFDVALSVQEELVKSSKYTYFNASDYNEFRLTYKGFVQTYDPFENEYSPRKKRKSSISLEQLLEKTKSFKKSS